MSIITVYRVFYWAGGRLLGRTGYVWETKEDQARCIKDSPPALMSGSQMFSAHQMSTPTHDHQRRDARYHISNQHCLCGIYGYFSPNYLSLVMTSGRGPGAVDNAGDMVHTRVRLGGLVDVHSMGARGEYGMIEEAWCDDGIAEAIAKQYDIPVNKSDYEKQPRTDPILDKDVKVKMLTPLFAGMPEALVMQKSLGPTPGPAVGSLFGNPVTFQQYMSLSGGNNPPPPPTPFGSAGIPPINPPMPRFAVGGPTPASAYFGPLPPWTSQLMRSMWNSKNALPRTGYLPPPNCQCAVCISRLTMKLWKCPACSIHEQYSSDHTVRKCNAALPKTVPVPVPIGVDTAYKPGIVARIKRAFRR